MRAAWSGTLEPMIPTGASSTRGQARGLPRLLACLATLTAVVVMHGPSTDHVLVMPTAAMTMSGPIGGVAAAAQTQDAAVTPMSFACVDVSSTAGMSHAQCLATTRPSSPLPGLAVLPVLIEPQQQAPRACAWAPAPARSPPKLSLDELCISRT